MWATSGPSTCATRSTSSSPSSAGGSRDPGAGPLSTTGSSAAPAPSTTSAAPDAAYPDAFAASVAARLYANGLSRRPVAVVTLPGADPATVSALTSQVKLAGGTVSGVYPVG